MTDRDQAQALKLCRGAHPAQHIGVVDRLRWLSLLCASMIWAIVAWTIPCAEASPALETLGALDSLTPWSVGLEGASSDAYFNPAGLAWGEQRTQFGVVGVSQHLSLKYDTQPPETLISDAIYRAEPIDARQSSSAALPSAELGERGLDDRASRQLFAIFGMTQPLISQRISLGVTALIPLHRFELQSPSYPDERAQYFGRELAFARWGDRLEGMSLAAGLGWRARSWLGLGVGVNFATRSVAQSDVFLSDASYQGISVISPRVEVMSSLNPHLSLELRSQSARGFVSVFTPEEVAIEGSSAVQIWNYPYPEGERALVQRFSQRYRALPWRVRWGGRLEIGSEVWSLVHSGQWSQWSAHVNRAGELSGWVDQVEVSGGIRRALDSSVIGVDIRWRPSPVPRQVGRSSYVDPSQLGLSLSGRWMITSSLSWQINAQGHRLIQRHDIKDARALDPVYDELPSSRDEITGELIESSIGLQTNNPGYPGYRSGGWVWSGGLSLIWER